MPFWKNLRAILEKTLLVILHKKKAGVLAGFVQFDEPRRDRPGTQAHRNKFFNPPE